MAVAEYLDSLKEIGCKVLHDFVERGKAWNIDHLLISEHGVFTIETKTLSKMEDFKREKIFYDGLCIKRESGIPVHSPLMQAEAQAHQISDTISLSYIDKTTK